MNLPPRVLNSLIIGGSGMLGLPVARQLKADGHQVTIMSSNPTAASERLGAEFEIVAGDVTDISSLRSPLQGRDLVYVSLSSHLDPELYRLVEVLGTEHVARVCREKRVGRLMLISSATSRGQREGPVYLMAKVDAERAVKESGVPYTIMRPSWFFESLPSFLHAGKISLICRQSLPRRWVAVADYAAQVSQAAVSEAAIDRCFYNFGPEPISIHDAVERFRNRCHPDIEMEQFPAWLARVATEASRDTGYLRTIDFFEYMNNRAEQGDSTEADRILGSNETTLDEWLEAYRRTLRHQA